MSARVMLQTCNNIILPCQFRFNCSVVVVKSCDVPQVSFSDYRRVTHALLINACVKCVKRILSSIHDSPLYTSKPCLHLTWILAAPSSIGRP